MTAVGATAIGGTSHDHQGPACTHIDICAVTHVAAVLSGGILVLDVATNGDTRDLIPVLRNQLLLRIDTPPPRV